MKLRSELSRLERLNMIANERFYRSIADTSDVTAWNKFDREQKRWEEAIRQNGSR